MKFEEVETTWDQVIYDTNIGVYGHCKCRRPGYNRENPECCRWRKKPFREVYLERSKRGEIVSYDRQLSKRIKEETEKELQEYKEKYGDEDPFVWLERLANEAEEKEKETF